MVARMMLGLAGAERQAPLELPAFHWPVCLSTTNESRSIQCADYQELLC
jgi:hypothetical protein